MAIKTHVKHQRRAGHFIPQEMKNVKNRSTGVTSNGKRKGSDSFVAGRVSNYEYVPKWREAPETILKIFKGYRTPLKNVPSSIKLSRSISRKFQIKVSSSEIKKLMEAGAITQHEKYGFLSTMFVRATSSGEYRPIFNLKRLNDFVSSPKFRLINHQQIPQHMMKLDITQAYFHVPICEK